MANQVPQVQYSIMCIRAALPELMLFAFVNGRLKGNFSQSRHVALLTNP